MFRRKKKDEPTDAPPAPEQSDAAEAATDAPAETEAQAAPEAAAAAPMEAPGVEKSENKPASSKRRGNRVQKVGTVSSDKMQKTVVVRVDRLVRHPKYRRYVRRTSKFMAHDDL